MMRSRGLKGRSKGGRDLISEAVKVAKVLAKAGRGKPEGAVSGDVGKKAGKLMDSDAVRLGGFMASRFLTIR